MRLTPEGIEPPLADLESAALPLNYGALIKNQNNIIYIKI